MAARQWDDRLLTRQLTLHAEKNPRHVALVDLEGRRRFTYQQLDRDSNRLANFLIEVGVKANDVVSVQLPNWYETVVIDMGVLKAGAVLNPILPVFRATELRHMLAIGSVRVLFTPQKYRDFEYSPMVESVTADLPHKTRHEVVANPETEPARFLEWLAGWPDSPPGRQLEASAVSELMFTSGTEAEPKAVMHTEQTTNYCIRTIASAIGMQPTDVVWMPSPIGHSTGLNYGVRMAFFFGLKLVLQDRWNALNAFRLIETEACSYTTASTTFLSDIVGANRTVRADLSSMRLFRCGGAPIPPELVAEAEDLGIGVLRGYGSTECLSVTLNHPGSDRTKRIRTDGHPLPGVDLEIRDEIGAPVHKGSPGEVFARGPQTSVGFLLDPARTRATFEPTGWVRSGDLGVLDDDDYLTIVGRKKEIIIRGGLNVAPREVEELILRMPVVKATAVVGLPHPRLGETGCAFVVLEPGASLTLAELIAHLKNSGLAIYKLPERLEVLTEMPMTATGKVQKQALVSRLAARTSESSEMHRGKDG